MQSRKKRTFGIITTALVLMSTILSACGGSSGTTGTGQKAPDDKQVYRTAITGVSDIKTFDPAMATDQFSIDAIMLAYNGLVSLDDNLKVVPELAQSYSESKDGLTYTFKLRPNLKFSNGDPLTSADVAYSLDRALDKNLNSPAAPSYLNLINHSDKRLDGSEATLIGDSIKTPDPDTVVITLNTPASYFLATLTYPTAYVVNKKIVEKYGPTKFTDHIAEGAGSGPFNVQEWVHGQRITYVPNSNYALAKPQLKKITSIFVKDAETAYQDYQNGQIDTTGVPTVHLAEAQKLTDQYHKVPILAIFYFGMNFLSKPFNNIHIRQAFELALNKDQIIHTAFHDVDVPTNHIVPKGMPGYNENLKGPDGTTSTKGNPDMAKKLLEQGMKEEGYANIAALPKITFKYPSGSDDTDNEIAIAVQQWKDVLGVTVTPEATDFETLTAAEPKTVGNDSLQFFSAGWGQDYPDPQDFLTLQFAKNSPNNTTNVGQNQSSDAAVQQQVQADLAKADVEQDNTKRMQMYNDAEQKLVNDVAWLPILQLARSRLLKSNVHGRVFNAGDITPQQDWANVYITQ